MITGGCCDEAAAAAGVPLSGERFRLHDETLLGVLSVGELCTYNGLSRLPGVLLGVLVSLIVVAGLVSWDFAISLTTIFVCCAMVARSFDFLRSLRARTGLFESSLLDVGKQNPGLLANRACSFVCDKCVGMLLYVVS